MSSLLDVLGIDPRGGEGYSKEDLKVHIEEEIIKRKPSVNALSCGVHLELVNLVDENSLTVKDCGCLHVSWVTGRYVVSGLYRFARCLSLFYLASVSVCLSCLICHPELSRK